MYVLYYVLSMYVYCFRVGQRTDPTAPFLAADIHLGGWEETLKALLHS